MRTAIARSRLLAGSIATVSLLGNAATPVAIPPGEYDLTTQTVLPHLEEALRYSTSRTQRCLRAPDATETFPLLQHPSFTGCILIPDSAKDDGLHFTLQCVNRAAATGAAVFEIAPHYVSAVLEIKMGGKNMTLSQRLYGPRIGPCPAGARRQ